MREDFPEDVKRVIAPYMESGWSGVSGRCAVSEVLYETPDRTKADSSLTTPELKNVRGPVRSE
jgi:hypothetical protein